MTVTNYRHLFACICATALLASPIALAQAYPDRPVRLVVPYPSGGPTDMLARSIGQQLQKRLGQPVVIDNRPGAGGAIGADHVAKAPADGYTLMLTTAAGLVVNPVLNPKAGYRASDFAPVSSAATYSMFLAVNPKLGANTMGELVSLAKLNPGKLTYGSSGNGTSNHLAGELLARMAGIDLVHVPYRGNAAAMTDVIGGTISMMFDMPSTTLPQARSGKVKLVGTTGERRNHLAPQVPTVIEGGVTGFNVTSWFAVFAPGKTPPEIVKRLSVEIVEILGNPTVSAQLVEQGYDVAGSTPERLAQMVVEDAKVWSDLIRHANIKAD